MAARVGRVSVRFYEELNDFLPRERRKKPFPARFHEGDTVKALIESLGVPHTEVDLILVDGQSVSFAHRLAHGDRISVYPVFETLEIGAVSKLRPRALRRTRFVLDVHLGRLARGLRLLGFDAHYANDLGDAELSRISHEQRRIILTRDRELLKRSIISHGYCVRSARPAEQIVEVLKRFDLVGKIRPFSRCLRCNVRLRKRARQEVRTQVPQYVARTYKSFSSCPSCGRLYWRGSHWQSMRRFLEKELELKSRQAGENSSPPAVSP